MDKLIELIRHPDRIHSVSLSEMPILLGEIERLRSLLKSHMFLRHTTNSPSFKLADAVTPSQSASKEREHSGALMTMREVAAFLGIGRSTVYQVVRSSGLPVIRFGRSVRVSRATVEQWLAEHRDDR